MSGTVKRDHSSVVYFLLISAVSGIVSLWVLSVPVNQTYITLGMRYGMYVQVRRELAGAGFLFLACGFGDQTQVSGLGSKRCYPLSPLFLRHGLMRPRLCS